MSLGYANYVEYENASDNTASGYDSFSDSDSEDDEAAMTEEERKLEREMRAAERQLVLEAAGIVVKKDTTRRPPPRLERRRAVKPAPPKHRPAPVPPGVTSSESVPASIPAPDLSEPSPPTPAKAYLDDAYERYEAFRQHSSRLSISSIDQLPPLSPVSPSVGSFSPAPAQLRESFPDKEKGNVSTLPSYGSRISQLLTRSRTPGQEKETRIIPTISAPMMGTTASDSATLGPPAREDSPGFGSVRVVLAVLLRGTISLTIGHGVMGKPGRQVCAGGPPGS